MDKNSIKNRRKELKMTQMDVIAGTKITREAYINLEKNFKGSIDNLITVCYKLRVKLIPIRLEDLGDVELKASADVKTEVKTQPMQEPKIGWRDKLITNK